MPIVPNPPFPDTTPPKIIDNNPVDEPPFSAGSYRFSGYKLLRDEWGNIVFVRLQDLSQPDFASFRSVSTSGGAEV